MSFADMLKAILDKITDFVNVKVVEMAPGVAAPGAPSAAAPGALSAAAPKVPTGMLAGIGGITGALAKMATASTVAFAGVAASLGGLAAAASPVAWTSLTQSFQLLATVAGGPLTQGIVWLTFRIQDAAAALKTVNPMVVASIAGWSAMGAGALGAAMLLSRVGSIVSGVVLPVLGALRIGLLALATNPFAILLAGLAAVAIKSPEAFKPLIDAGKTLGTALSGAAGPALQLLTRVMDAFAAAATSVLTPAIKAVADILLFLGDCVTAAMGALGGVESKFITAALAAVVFMNPIRAVVVGGMMLMNMLNQLSPGLGTVAAAATGAAFALRALTLAAATNPWTALLTVVGAVTGAVLAMSGAFGAAGDQANRAAQKIADLEALLRKMKAGEAPTPKEVEAAFIRNDQDEGGKAAYARYLKAKTPEERNRLLEEATANADFQAKQAGTPEEARKQAAHVGMALEELIGPRGPNRLGQTREEQLQTAHAAIKKGLVASGAPEKDAEIRAAKIVKANEAPGGLGFGFGSSLPFNRWGQDMVEAIKKAMVQPAEQAEQRKKALDAAREQGGFGEKKRVGDEAEVLPMPKQEPTFLEMLLEHQGKYAMAYHKEGVAGSMEITEVRRNVQAMGLNKNPIELLILQEQRHNDRIAALAEANLQELKKIRQGVGVK
jgi:hypothetical protein